ncbi:MAG: phosphatidylglycerophosphatase A [Candidatus Omnitrophota bacterium]
MDTKNLYNQISTIFGLGNFPVAQGTMGSLAGLIPCVLLHRFQPLYILTFFALFLAGAWSSAKTAKEAGFKDPAFVIIDEFACIFIVFLFIPLNVLTLIAGFILYRLFDILKPQPIKALERIPSGWGIMLDDLMAAIYANLALRIFT